MGWKKGGGVETDEAEKWWEILPLATRATS